MAHLIAGFGTSHSPMLAASVESWQSGIFAERDRRRALVDAAGNDCRFEDALAAAPEDALRRIAPDRIRERHALAQTAIARLRADIAGHRLDALIVIGDDQEELFDHTNMPAIGIYYGEAIRADPQAEYPCAAPLAQHLIAAVREDGFDPATMSGLRPGQAEGHAFTYVHRFCLEQTAVPIVPVFLNAYYPPNQPSPARCHALGQSIARAIAAWPQPQRVGVLASGGLSHFLVDEALDQTVIDALRRRDAAALRGLPLHKLRSGSSEIRNWICLAGAVESLVLDWVTYVPGYRSPALTGTGLCFASFR